MLNLLFSDSLFPMTKLSSLSHAEGGMEQLYIAIFLLFLRLVRACECKTEEGSVAFISLSSETLLQGKRRESFIILARSTQL
jgi:hypothetical protein